jgi:hypothetical protein
LQTVNIQISGLSEMHFSVVAEETVATTVDGQTVIIIEHPVTGDDHEETAGSAEEEAMPESIEEAVDGNVSNLEDVIDNRITLTIP